MGIAEDWKDLMFDLSCLSKQVANDDFANQLSMVGEDYVLADVTEPQH